VHKAITGFIIPAGDLSTGSSIVTQMSQWRLKMSVFILATDKEK